QDTTARLGQLCGGPVPKPARASLLRERMALIDLETTPMVPIPPPNTRVGVPPIPEARRSEAAEAEEAVAEAFAASQDAAVPVEAAEEVVSSMVVAAAPISRVGPPPAPPPAVPPP